MQFCNEIADLHGKWLDWRSVFEMMNTEQR